ncbi:type IV secretory system conjugative DNA transfer family protein [bacterium]|nr:type IV secretory system conjugative DNA transfer family protein [bacterium]
MSAYYYSLETFIEQYVNNSNLNEEELYKLADNINLASVISVLNNKEQLKKYISDIANMEDENMQQVYMKKKSYETGVKVFSSPDATLGSAYANVEKATSNYSNESIKKLISSNQIDLSKIANENKPTAVFIIIAEGDEKSYKLLAMFVDQLYSFCIRKAETYFNNKLPRNLLLILDEFCNMPRLNHASQFFTLGAGRRIMAMIIVQSLTQLNDVYGNEKAKTIIDNCATHAYIKSIDEKTNEYYSK